MGVQVLAGLEGLVWGAELGEHLDLPGRVNLGVPVLRGAASGCAATLGTFFSAANWELSGHPS